MGRGYRTPSPMRGVSREELTPKANAYPPLDVVMSTPTLVPSTPRVMPSTPAGDKFHSMHFGLLTPSTPCFGGFTAYTPVAAEIQDDGTNSDSTIDAGDGAQITTAGNARGLREWPKRRQSATACIYEGTNTENNDEPLQTQYEKFQEQIREAELTVEIAEQTASAGTRRSTRLAEKEVVKAPASTIKPTTLANPMEPTKKTPTAIIVPPPESSLSAEALVQLAPDYNPAHLTLEWQLQYPPGGSTHPSYAYPQMDPRLTFDPAFVPIVAGLPSVFEVSDLVLPMNWRHVSWSGCLPIVFDPYHQAFKLTPIGPLPLTHEEVQQNGLAKYVPGGSAHPEAGLLPDIAPLSDGSDETYNFVDVDWVLPWPKGQTFDAMLIGGELMASRGSLSPATDAGPLSVLTAAHTYYIEERDCPDDVVDIIDAWRWLAEKCQDIFTKFEPTAEKSWKGTGIRNTTKKLKQPLASLLASALAETIASPNDFLAPFLIKQNGREFCPLRSVATPVHVNIALLGDTEFTLKELMCYFPSHYMWRKGGDRLVRAGWGAGDISNMINMTRQLSGDATKKNSSVHYAITYEAEKGETGTKVRIVRDEQDNETQSYTAENWVYDTLESVDYPVLGLAHGLIDLPAGPDAGPLTALIAFCKKNAKYNVLLSNVPAMLQEAGISSFIEPGDGGCPDKEVWSRHIDLLKDDRKRVLKVEKERKRAMEMEEGGKRKRVKTE